MTLLSDTEEALNYLICTSVADSWNLIMYMHNMQ